MSGALETYVKCLGAPESFAVIVTLADSKHSAPLIALEREVVLKSLETEDQA